MSEYKDIKSPLEVEKGVGSKEFKETKKVFEDIVKGIQEEEGCTYLEAREIFFERRGRKENK